MKISNLQSANLESTVIRSATINDLQSIAEIKMDKQTANGCVTEGETVIHGLFMREYKKRWEQRLQTSISTLVLSCDEQIYGFVSCSILPETQDKFANAAEMTSLYILPDMRRRGLGSMLCHAGLTRLKELGFLAVIVWIPECSLPLVSFYESMGFRATTDFRQEVVHDQVAIKEVKHQIDLKIT